jgi:tetratricopeptide (TPR) repeat protein
MYAQALDVLTPALEKSAGDVERTIDIHKELAAVYTALRRIRPASEALATAFELSYAFGYLGALYGTQNQLDSAMTLTRKAAFEAQQIRAADALYTWQWQCGRLLKKKGELDAAIASYQAATRALEPIRNSLALGHGNQVSNASSRESVGKLFIELADLLLLRADTLHDEEAVTEQLLAARDVMEQFKTAELEDYFQDECVNLYKQREKLVDQIAEKTAIV